MRVLVTGAAGRIGRTVTAGLTERGHDVNGIDLVPTEGIDRVDATDIPALVQCFDGRDAVVHLAGYAGEGSYATAMRTHLDGTYAVLEAMRITGVPRIVYASSHHAVGFAPVDDEVGADARPRPDTFYGAAKVAAEALCSLYADRFGIAAACLRIGAFRDRPATRRHLAVWLSPDDAVRLVDACLTAPDLEYAVVYGISANTRAWLDLEPGRRLGYRPRDDADDYAAEILATPPSERDTADARYVGGSFCNVPSYLQEHPDDRRT